MVPVEDAISTSLSLERKIREPNYFASCVNKWEQYIRQYRATYCFVYCGEKQNKKLIQLFRILLLCVTKLYNGRPEFAQEVHIGFYQIILLIRSKNSQKLVNSNNEIVSLSFLHRKALCMPKYLQLAQQNPINNFHLLINEKYIVYVVLICNSYYLVMII